MTAESMTHSMNSPSTETVSAESCVNVSDRRVKLRQQFDRLLVSGARESYWFQSERIERLLTRANCEASAVAERLLLKAEQQVIDLDARLSRDCSPKPSLNSTIKHHSLMALISEIQPETPSYSEASQGAAFDEFLQQQENNILQTMVGESSDTDAADLAPALTRANRYLRHRQLHSSATRLVDLAIEHGPENPGPLNPEMLSIKSLKLMRDLSPQYLNRFVAFIDSLLWIEESVEGVAGSKAPLKGKPKSRPKTKSNH